MFSINIIVQKKKKKGANKIPIINNYTENKEFLKNTMYLRQTSEEGIIGAIFNLKSKKSLGIGNIRSETLKEIA